MGTYIEYKGEKYYHKEWRVQCLDCDQILSQGTCICGLITAKNGQIVSDNPWDKKDVSIWKTADGTKTLPQAMIDMYFNIGRPDSATIKRRNT